MRVGIDASNLRSIGGVTHLVELLGAARPYEHGITHVVVWAGRDLLEKIASRPWLQGIYDPMLDRSLAVRQYWQTVRLPRLARQACNILFVPGGICRGSLIPTVTMSQNMLPFERAEMRRYGASWMFLKLYLTRLSQSRTFRHADGLIFLNEYARATIMQQTKLQPGRWMIVPHGVDTRFRLAPRPQKPLSTYANDKPFKLLYVSTVDVYKHQWNVAEAVAQLRREGMPIELDLVGSAYPPALRRLRKVLSRVDPRRDFIHYRGTVPFSELAHCYHRADSFVFASSCENMPKILLEAMASGLPIACSRRGPMPEILGDGGAYFDPDRPEVITRALKILLEDPSLRERYAWAGYERAQTYSWDRCARDTLNFIAQVAKFVRVWR